ncbi:hypothetical protein T492DRAFT_836096 [Pavlovales sp. CCMP2436]|nr:hypothetical protein T492DRAFT_836096 [Pavlovales sp. CCMP2436]
MNKAVAAGIPVPPAPARAANGHSKELVLPQIPHPLRKAFAQVQVAMRTGPESWRLRACYGAARLLEHVHGGGQAPLCAYKAIVQVDAPPRSVRKMVLDLKEGRRLWDQTFENGNCVDTLTATSDIAHIVLAPVSSILDVVVWRHWVPLPPDLATANPTAEGVSSSAFTNPAAKGVLSAAVRVL